MVRCSDDEAGQRHVCSDSGLQRGVQIHNHSQIQICRLRIGSIPNLTTLMTVPENQPLLQVASRAPDKCEVPFSSHVTPDKIAVHKPTRNPPKLAPLDQCKTGLPPPKPLQEQQTATAEPVAIESTYKLGSDFRPNQNAEQPNSVASPLSEKVTTNPSMDTKSDFPDESSSEPTHPTGHLKDVTTEAELDNELPAVFPSKQVPPHNSDLKPEATVKTEPLQPKVVQNSIHHGKPEQRRVHSDSGLQKMDVPESEQKPNCFHQNDSYNMDFAMVMTVPVYKPLPQPAAKAPDKRRLPLPSRVHLDKSVVHVEEGRPPDDLVLAGEPELKCSRSTQSRSHSEPASSEMHVVNQSRKRHKSVSNLSNLTPYKFANVDTSRRVPSIQITNRQRWCTIWFLIAQVQSQPVALKLVISMIGPQGSFHEPPSQNEPFQVRDQLSRFQRTVYRRRKSWHSTIPPDKSRDPESAQPCKRRSNLREFHAVLPAIEDVGERREPADQSAAIHRKRCVGRAKELRDLNGGSMFGTNEARNPTVTTICVADDEGETFSGMENSILPKRESVESVNNYLKRYRREAIGGGCVGALIAYWLKKRAQNRLNVIVVKKDATYQGVSLGVSTCLAVSGLR
ncbi:FAD oxidoreductase [Culex quinquefasciatus]|uniref:FAD oxidoreductase n=1 Tax=Culex quinquefasciatus TaxID=7176 RepID=B0XAE3_CULQU|nr:FAD oxidoreductase [Culex quinquefasciatus]|eukprot:XP_001866615.1 FAD oxidoreductase [Culex quinquefasciatus]